MLSDIRSPVVAVYLSAVRRLYGFLDTVRMQLYILYIYHTLYQLLLLLLLPSRPPRVFNVLARAPEPSLARQANKSILRRLLPGGAYYQNHRTPGDTT